MNHKKPTEEQTLFLEQLWEKIEGMNLTRDQLVDGQEIKFEYKGKKLVLDTKCLGNRYSMNIGMFARKIDMKACALIGIKYVDTVCMECEEAIDECEC